MESKEYKEYIKQLIIKLKNNEPLSITEAADLSSFKQSKRPKFDFSGVKVVRNDKDEYDEER